MCCAVWCGAVRCVQCSACMHLCVRAWLGELQCVTECDCVTISFRHCERVQAVTRACIYSQIPSPPTMVVNSPVFAERCAQQEEKSCLQLMVFIFFWDLFRFQNEQYTIPSILHPNERNIIFFILKTEYSVPKEHTQRKTRRSIYV